MNVFWKGNKIKGGNQDALQSAEINILTKIALQPEFFL